jgi:hypothetical protein
MEIPAYNVQVEGSQFIATQKPEAGTSGTSKAPVSPKIARRSMLDTGDNVKAPKTPSSSMPWWKVAAAFALGMVAMFLLGLLAKLFRTRHHRHYTESEALKLLYPHIKESEEIEAMVRRLYARQHGDKKVDIDPKILQKMLEKVALDTE